MVRKTSARIHVGIGGWNYQPWRGAFYPKGLLQKHELGFASSKLGSIEINSTFYALQKPATFSRWYAETPKDFVFAIKAPRFVTNRRVLAEGGDAIRRFLNSGVLLLREKLGPINWQLGPARTFDASDVEAFLKLLPRQMEGRAIRHAIEVRHASFATPVFQALALRNGIAIVLAGDSKFPEITDEGAPFVYARIMGTRGNLRNGYSDKALDAWAGRAKSWAKEGREVFLYVISGFKALNPAAAMALIERTVG